jgi:hypothetical protein
MDLAEAISQAEERLAALRDERDSLRARLDANSAEGNRLSGIVAALREAATTFGTPDQKAKAEAAAERMGEEDWRGLGRTEATLRAVTEADVPVGPTEIVKSLQRKGRTDDTIHLVSAALGYLARHHKVGSVGRAQWVPYDRLPATTTDPKGDRPTGLQGPGGAPG